MLRMFAKALAGLAALSLLAAPASAGRIGGEFTIAGNGLNSEIARLQSGGFAVAWRGPAPKYAVYARIYKANGKPLAPAFKVTKSAGELVNIAIAGLSDGGFTVLWDAAGASGLEVYGQRYATDGTGIKKRFMVNTVTANDQHEPAVTGLGGGGFVASWTSDQEAGSISALFLQRFKDNGKKAGGPVRADTTLMNGFHHLSSITELSNGKVAAVWRGYNGTYARLFTAKGAPVGLDTRVNVFIESLLHHPVIAAWGNGGFVVVREVLVGGSDVDLYARRYRRSGAAKGGDFLVNKYTPDYQYDPAATGLDNGGFAVLWESAQQSHWVYGRIYTPQGKAAGKPVKINKQQTSPTPKPSLAPYGAQGFVASYGGISPAIVAQRFDGL
jgi:hypothetical protein